MSQDSQLFTPEGKKSENDNTTDSLGTSCSMYPNQSTDTRLLMNDFTDIKKSHQLEDQISIDSKIQNLKKKIHQEEIQKKKLEDKTIQLQKQIGTLAQQNQKLELLFLEQNQEHHRKIRILNTQVEKVTQQNKQLKMYLNGIKREKDLLRIIQYTNSLKKTNNNTNQDELGHQATSSRKIFLSQYQLQNIYILPIVELSSKNNQESKSTLEWGTNTDENYNEELLNKIQHITATKTQLEQKTSTITNFLNQALQQFKLPSQFEISPNFTVETTTQSISRSLGYVYSLIQQKSNQTNYLRLILQQKSKSIQQLTKQGENMGKTLTMTHKIMNKMISQYKIYCSNSQSKQFTPDSYAQYQKNYEGKYQKIVSSLKDINKIIKDQNISFEGLSKMNTKAFKQLIGYEQLINSVNQKHLSIRNIMKDFPNPNESQSTRTSIDVKE